MIGILLFTLLINQGHATVSHGNSFITAFPENIGYFYPQPLQNLLMITALYNNTYVTISCGGVQKSIPILQSGQSQSVMLPSSTEVHQLGFFNEAILVTSVQNITVLSVSVRGSSIQTSVVQPIVTLGTSYSMPKFDYSDYLLAFGLQQFDDSSPRYGSFKLVIINAVNSTNNVKLSIDASTGIIEEPLQISPYQLAQIQFNSSVLKVESEYEVALFLTHPCLETTDCGCHMFLKQILSSSFYGQSFVVPSIFNVSQTDLLVVSDEDASQVSYNGDQLNGSLTNLLPFPHLQTSQEVSASANLSLWLISQYLVVELIPENLFSACYLLLFSGSALVIAETKSKDSVHTNSGPLTGSTWTQIAGTIYSTTIVNIQSQLATIWHPSSKIAVYILVKTQWTPVAMPVSDTPDLWGCMGFPGEYSVGENLQNWMESHDYCLTNADQLACPVNETTLDQMVSALTGEEDDGWIGLRRSLMTTEWYWQDDCESQTPVTYVHWAEGFPLDPVNGLCTSMSLDQEYNFTWQSSHCCTKKKPVCYTRPKYFNLNPSFLQPYYF